MAYGYDLHKSTFNLLSDMIRLEKIVTTKYCIITAITSLFFFYLSSEFYLPYFTEDPSL